MRPVPAQQEVKPYGVGVVDGESWMDDAGLCQRAAEQQRRDEQKNGHRHLRHHERVSKPAAVRPTRRGHGSERGEEIDLGRLDRRQQSTEQRGPHREHGGEGDNAPVDPEVDTDMDRERGNDRAKKLNEDEREAEAGNGSDERDQEALGDEETHDASRGLRRARAAARLLSPARHRAPAASRRCWCRRSAE